MRTDKLESGVLPHENSVFGKMWYGWAAKGNIYKEGVDYKFKWRAWLDSRSLRAKVKKLG